jgi:hypothetical protein
MNKPPLDHRKGSNIDPFLLPLFLSYWLLIPSTQRWDHYRRHRKTLQKC